jgi:hypothetical protein
MRSGLRRSNVECRRVLYQPSIQLKIDLWAAARVP